MTAIRAILLRDLRLAVRQGGAMMTALGFFLLIGVFFPFALGPEPGRLGLAAGGLVWLAALLANLLTLDRLFQPDFEDGSLDQLRLQPTPLIFIVLAKTFAHWLTTGLPLVLAAPLLALMLRLPAEGWGALLAALALGTPAISLLGAVGGALTVAMRRGGVLLSLLVLPLYIPVLIFGAGAVEASVTGLPAAPHLMVLAALDLLQLAVCPAAAAAAIRLATE